MKVCIVGSAESSISLAPFQDPEWEIWSCSPTMRLLPRIGVAFELHKYDRTVEPFSPEYVSWLNDFDGIVWMMAEYPQVKNCEVIPYKALMKKYSPYFFTSSIAWMMALAIEVADEISLYGVDMAASTEYYDQKMGCQFFAQIAKKKGIKVSVPLRAICSAHLLYMVSGNTHTNGLSKPAERESWRKGEMPQMRLFRVVR